MKTRLLKMILVLSGVVLLVMAGSAAYAANWTGMKDTWTANDSYSNGVPLVMTGWMFSATPTPQIDLMFKGSRGGGSFPLPSGAYAKAHDIPSYAQIDQKWKGFDNPAAMIWISNHLPDGWLGWNIFGSNPQKGQHTSLSPGLIKVMNADHFNPAQIGGYWPKGVTTPAGSTWSYAKGWLWSNGLNNPPVVKWNFGKVKVAPIHNPYYKAAVYAASAAKKPSASKNPSTSKKSTATAGSHTSTSTSSGQKMSSHKASSGTTKKPATPKASSSGSAPSASMQTSARPSSSNQAVDPPTPIEPQQVTSLPKARPKPAKEASAPVKPQKPKSGQGGLPWYIWAAAGVLVVGGGGGFLISKSRR